MLSEDLFGTGSLIVKVCYHVIPNKYFFYSFLLHTNLVLYEGSVKNLNLYAVLQYYSTLNLFTKKINVIDILLYGLYQ